MGRRAEERLSATARAVAPRRSSWPAVLLAASILSSGFLPTEAQGIEVIVKPSQTLRQGQDATLTPGETAQFVLCKWFRGGLAEVSRILTYHPPPSDKQQNGPGFTGRETGGPGCSLHIQNVTLSDNGTYTVLKTSMGGFFEIGRVQIEVIAAAGSPPPSSGFAAGAIWGLVLGSLAAAGLAGTLLFCFLRARSPKMNPNSPIYENTRPSAQTQGMPENSSDVNHTYEELQHGRRSVYDQLKW